MVAGSEIGIPPLLAAVPDEVLLGLDDRHLDFRVSVRVLDDDREVCGRAETAGWPWTVSVTGVSCVGCGLLLDKAKHRSPSLCPPPGGGRASARASQR